MTTTEDLYQQAIELFEQNRKRGLSWGYGISSVVDFVLASRDEQKPWKVLEQAANLMHPPSHPTGLWSPTESELRRAADQLEAEYRAEQEKKAERENLIEQAAILLYDADHSSTFGDWSSSGDKDSYRSRARALIDAGWRPAPDCGHPSHGASDHDCGPFIPESDGGEQE